MKKQYIHLILLLSGICAGTLSAQKCDITSDPFTNQRSVVSNYGDKLVYFENKGGKFKMEMVFTYSGAIDATVPKGAEVFYKLENGETVKLVSTNDSAPKRQAVATQYSAQITTNYSYVFDITLEELKKFAASKVTVIRFPDTKGGTSDFEGKNGKGLVKAISKGAACVVDNL